MRCEVKTKSDLLTGATLIVSIPDNDLDRKALYTIQAEKPDFLLPFHYRCIDGKIEIVYHIGTNNKLQHLAGSCMSKEYAELWSSVLDPLLCCKDWFMKPYSFVLSADHLYYDKKKKSVSYIYVPSKSDCCDNGDLKEMAAEVSRMITVSDAALENKVLRAIMKNFDPQEFLEMLDTYSAGSDAAVSQPSRINITNTSIPVGADATNRPHEPERASRTQAQKNDTNPSIAATPDARHSQHNVPGEITIDITEKKSAKNKKTAKNKDGNAVKSEKEAEKEQKNHVGFGRLFGRKKTVNEEAIQEPTVNPSALAGNAASVAIAGSTTDVLAPAAAFSHEAYTESSDITQSLTTGASGARLHCIGRESLPPVIDVLIGINEFYSFGRHDASLGRQQSSFEFDKKTKAVSRRHAVIERNADGYSVTDLASTAGTFLDGQKIPPNTPFKLEQGSRVSFGNSGADYIWEC